MVDSECTDILSRAMVWDCEMLSVDKSERRSLSRPATVDRTGEAGGVILSVDLKVGELPCEMAFSRAITIGTVVLINPAKLSKIF